MTDYLVLINREHKISKEFLDKVELVNAVNVDGEACLLEKNCVSKYYELEKFCKKQGILIAIDGAYRSLERQKEIFDDFCNRYGEEYAKKTVAPVGTSEHHSGLAIDLTISVDGGKTFLSENSDLIKNDKIFKKIHHSLSEFGFILRYPKGKEAITGYDYEPWHIRYVGVDNAKKIEASGLTFDEYKQNENNNLVVRQEMLRNIR